PLELGAQARVVIDHQEDRAGAFVRLAHHIPAPPARMPDAGATPLSVPPATASFSVRAEERSGRRTTNVLPSPGLLATSMSPPSSRTYSRLSNAPIPMPPALVVENGRNRWPRMKTTVIPGQSSVVYMQAR